ncbi:MAG: hypothetical protein JF922_03800 [Candidatus Dormibacteraeota bacterium]|uniref:Uncharacterized protein n=1 Tax=Candidatus Nephthysia bennettiae TaxID=3127016 RepID=A0A934K7K0_9BACT|nr:hypothetical protein [Candidatus Dormibacteraeota bacterium]
MGLAAAAGTELAVAGLTTGVAMTAGGLTGAGVVLGPPDLDAGAGFVAAGLATAGAAAAAEAAGFATTAGAAGVGTVVETAAFCTGLGLSVPVAASADPCCVGADARTASKARKTAPPNS